MLDVSFCPARQYCAQWGASAVTTGTATSAHVGSGPERARSAEKAKVAEREKAVEKVLPRQVVHNSCPTPHIAFAASSSVLVPINSSLCRANHSSTSLYCSKHDVESSKKLEHHTKEVRDSETRANLGLETTQRREQ